jgi:ferritin-like metal-binding protein YciE
MSGTPRTRVKELLGFHLEESRANVQNLESVFGLAGWEVDEAPCPVAEVFEKEDKSKIKKARPGVVDSVVLQGVVEIEHYGIGVYENLIIRARAMKRQDVVELLQRNVRAKQMALEKTKALLADLAAPAGVSGSATG